MKKYKVSLALKVLSNFETEIRATTQKEALMKVLEKYDNGDFDENNITDPDWCNMELDINDEGNIDDVGNGIYIEEI